VCRIFEEEMVLLLEGYRVLRENGRADRRMEYGDFGGEFFTIKNLCGS